MKKSLCLGVLVLLPLSLVGCVSDDALVGRWQVVGEPDCQVGCAFDWANTSMGSYIVYVDEEVNDRNGPVKDMGHNHYVVNTPAGDTRLELAEGRLSYPWGRTFERDESQIHPRCFWQWGR